MHALCFHSCSRKESWECSEAELKMWCQGCTTQGCIEHPCARHPSQEKETSVRVGEWGRQFGVGNKRSRIQRDQGGIPEKEHSWTWDEVLSGVRQCWIPVPFQVCTLNDLSHLFLEGTEGPDLFHSALCLHHIAQGLITKRKQARAKVNVTQSCPTLCDPMDYTVQGILHTRILEWVAISFSRGSFQPRDRTQVSHTDNLTGHVPDKRGFMLSWRGFLGTSLPVQQLRICLPMQIWSLVGELRSDMLQLLSPESLTKIRHSTEKKGRIRKDDFFRNTPVGNILKANLTKVRLVEISLAVCLLLTLTLHCLEFWN